MKILYTGFLANSFIDYSTHRMKGERKAKKGVVFSIQELRIRRHPLRRHGGYNIIRSANLAATRLTVNIVVRVGYFYSRRPKQWERRERIKIYQKTYKNTWVSSISMLSRLQCMLRQEANVVRANC